MSCTPEESTNGCTFSAQLGIRNSRAFTAAGPCENRTGNGKSPRTHGHTYKHIKRMRSVTRTLCGPFRRCFVRCKTRFSQLRGWEAKYSQCNYRYLCVEGPCLTPCFFFFNRCWFARKIGSQHWSTDTRKNNISLASTSGCHFFPITIAIFFFSSFLIYTCQNSILLLSQ